MAIHRYLTLKEIALAMGMTPAWLYRHVRELERHGFPTPAPGMGQRRDAAAVEAWQQRQIERDRRAVSLAVKPEDWAATLDRRAGELGDD